MSISLIVTRYRFLEKLIIHYACAVITLVLYNYIVKTASARSHYSWRNSIPFAAAAAMVGVMAVMLTTAVGTPVAFEPEGGVLAGGAKVVAATGASGGSAVQFGAVVTPSPSPSPGIWHPGPGLSWQWQLTTPVDTTVNAQVFDIDMESNDASVVAALHAQGKKVVCYFETGFWESYRSDSGSYPASVLGAALEPPFNDERYVDIRQISILGPIIQGRLDRCKQKGFDAVEPDGDAMLFDSGGSVTGTSSGSGFPLTYNDMIAFNTYVANQAHARGLAIATKNATSADSSRFANDMQLITDFVVEEQCAEFGSCDWLAPFAAAGKAVFAAEYNGLTRCNTAAKSYPSYSFIFKKVALDATRTVCQ